MIAGLKRLINRMNKLSKFITSRPNAVKIGKFMMRKTKASGINRK